MKKLITLFILCLAVCSSANAGTYYSKATAVASGAGKVYVSKEATSSPSYGATNTVEQTTENAQSPPTHKYYFYAQPNDGKVFLGWYNGNTKVSENLSYTHDLVATSKESAKPTTISLTGRFADNLPVVTVKSDWASVTINNLTNKLGQKVNINTERPWMKSLSSPYYVEGQVNMAYQFDGWYDQNGELFSKETYTEFVIDRELELEARWSPRSGQIHGNGYYRIANMFNDYVQVVGDEDITFTTSTSAGNSFEPDLVWYKHPLRYYYRYSGDNGLNNNAFGEPSIIIYVEGTLNEANYKKYASNKPVVMTNMRMSAQGVVANDHMKGAAEGRECKITWSGANENLYHILAAVSNSLDLAFKTQFDDSKPPYVRGNNSDGFDDMHFEAVDLEHIDTNWFAAFPEEAMLHEEGYWSSMYTAFPFQCYEPDGVEAYYVTLAEYNGETLAVLHKIEDGIVPPHTPVLLKSPKVIDMSRYFSSPYHGFTPDPANRLLPLIPTDELEAKAEAIAAENALRGTYQLATAEKVTADDSKRVLSVSDAGGVGFYKLAANADGTPSELRGNRAYLQLPDNAAPANIRMIAATDLSGLDEVLTAPQERPDKDVIYDLYGRRVANPQPGTIYIRNGKKYITK